MIFFDEYCEGQNGLHTHLPVNVAFDAMGSFGVSKALRVYFLKFVLMLGITKFKVNLTAPYNFFSNILLLYLMNELSAF